MPEPLPLFGLNVPIVPGLVLPLHVFEPRYRELVAMLLAEPDEDAREFGIVAVRPGREPATDGLDALYPVGTSVLLRQVAELDDGRYDIVTVGRRRFTVTAVDVSRPLVQAEVEWLDDVTGPTDVAAAARVARAFGAYRAALTGQVMGSLDVVEVVDADGDDEGADDLPSDPTVLSYLVTAAMVLPMDQRQDLIAAPTTAARLTEALRLLRLETALIEALACVPALDLPGPAPSPN